MPSVSMTLEVSPFLSEFTRERWLVSISICCKADASWWSGLVEGIVEVDYDDGGAPSD